MARNFCFSCSSCSSTIITSSSSSSSSSSWTLRKLNLCFCSSLRCHGCSYASFSCTFSSTRCPLIQRSCSARLRSPCQSSAISSSCLVRPSSHSSTPSSLCWACAPSLKPLSPPCISSSSSSSSSARRGCWELDGIVLKARAISRSCASTSASAVEDNTSSADFSATSASCTTRAASSLAAWRASRARRTSWSEVSSLSMTRRRCSSIFMYFSVASNTLIPASRASCSAASCSSKTALPTL
mmetsp:Transcript_44442/g.140238  ORF Transcript_44442/g.140238 Transcript_44442/m.140238 type:complete len:241 (-) Transcript_44442:147-869(-)